MAYYARGFKGIEVYSIDGSDFEESYNTIKKVLKLIRTERRPFLIHAKVPLLGHHTSGVRMEFYRDDLDEHTSRDPRSEEHTSELQSRPHLVCRLLLEKKK